MFPIVSGSGFRSAAAHTPKLEGAGREPGAPPDSHDRHAARQNFPHPGDFKLLSKTVRAVRKRTSLFDLRGLLDAHTSTRSCLDVTKPRRSECQTVSRVQASFGLVLQRQPRQLLQHTHLRVVPADQHPVGHRVQVQLNELSVEQATLNRGAVTGVRHHVAQAG